MNKTVNINLAGIFFHIDEDAYLKLQRYLEAIKRSFTDSQGRSEIISDIEARISELFSERMKHDKQVISTKEVDDVISIMGQPEDYIVDDEIFEDEPQRNYTRSNSGRKLYRDTETSYVGGVSAGLGHYFGISAIWVRIIWLILVIGGFGSGILIYILLWIFIPEAKSTSEKIQMTGESVTISNIEKKIRDGFESVSETVGPSFQKAGDKLKDGFDSASENISNSVKRIDSNKIKSSSQTFFDAIADIFTFILKVFSKFVGVILMIASAAGFIAITVAFISSNFVDSVHIGNSNLTWLAQSSNTPLWLISMLLYFIIGIPLLLLFYLGLKILVNNLKSIGNVAKFTLLGVWILSIIGMSFVGVKQGISYSEKAPSITNEKFESITAQDTLVLTMRSNDNYAENFRRHFHRFNTGYNENGDKVIYSQGIRLIVKSTQDSTAKIKVVKSARGSSFEDAKTRASDISFNYELIGNELLLDNHFTVPNNELHRDQKVELTLYLPVGSKLYANENTHNYHSNNSNRYNDILEHGMENKYLTVANNKLICDDCPEEEEEDNDFEIDVNINSENAKIKFNSDGIEAKTEGNTLIIDDKGVKGNTKNVKVNIDEDGVKISSEKKE